MKYFQLISTSSNPLYLIASTFAAHLSFIMYIIQFEPQQI